MRHVMLKSNWRTAPTKGSTKLIALKKRLTDQMRVHEENGETKELESIKLLIADVRAALIKKRVYLC